MSTLMFNYKYTHIYIRVYSESIMSILKSIDAYTHLIKR